MKQWIHTLLVALFAIAVGLLYLEEPQFGDDFTYWTFGYDVHELGMAGWKADGFHQLRWPVWGLCWAAQAVFGFGLVSYYFVPFLMLVLGAWCAFAIGRHFFKRNEAGWLGAILFLFHPLLDANLTRPYPDVGEGVIGAGAVFAWWALMNADTRRKMILPALGCGFLLFVVEENRLTGLFFIPLLGILTLLFFPRRFLRFLLPLGVFGLLLFGQMLFYHVRFDNWTHFLDANARAKGRTGTEPVPLDKLLLIPFRFLDTLHKGSDVMPFYAVFGALGIWFAWRRHGRAGRVVVAWFFLLYLAYACAPQKLWPYRPMLREADRFLSSLAIPYAMLATIGLINSVRVLAGWSNREKIQRAAQWAIARPVTMLVLGAILLGVACFQPVGNRHLPTLGYVPALRAYMRNLPADAVVFTHHQALVLAHMVDHETASRIRWQASNEWITEPKPKLIAEAAKATDFWYIRKLALMRLAKGLATEDENKKLYKQPVIAPWFNAPDQDGWRLSAVFAKSDTPDIVLYRRRTPDAPPALILTPESPELKGLLPPLPFAWDAKQDKRNYHDNPLTFDWELPAVLKGKLVRVEMQSASEQRDAFGVQISFGTAKKWQEPYTLKPYFFRDGGKEFACLPIPADATRAQIRIRMAKDTEWLKLTGFRIIAE